MKIKSKIIIIIIVIVVILVAAVVIYWESTHGNRSLIDTKYRFDRAIIRLPNGEIADGKVTSWLDYDDSDVVQVTIDGKTYLSHDSNVCLIDE
jgi:flagellar basal body-associated protein FliL